MIPSKNDLAEAIYKSTKYAFISLIKEHPEHFYYFALITTGEAHSPFISAWSYEALEKADKEVKWSYADSPYCFYKEEAFESVKALFELRPQLTRNTSVKNWEKEYELRIEAMELAMQKLNIEGIFGKGSERNNIVINVEVMPPDHTNTERAKRLNPDAALKFWLEEV